MAFNQVLSQFVQFALDNVSARTMQHINSQQELLIAAMTNHLTESDRPRERDPPAIPRVYSDPTFQSHFRMQRTTFQTICERIGSLVKGKSHGAEKKILEFLWISGSTESFRSVADRFGISKGTLHFHFVQVTRALVCIRNELIKILPTNEADLNALSLLTGGLPGVVACVDGTHIQISGRGAKDGEQYINRKGHSSMQLQITCDAKLKILHIFTGYPGFVHGARVFRNEDLFLSILEGMPAQFHILGDGAHKLTQYCITLFRDTGDLTQAQNNYNTVHASARCCVERCIGLLKSKFRRLKYLEIRKDKLVCSTITACCVLHNFILQEESAHENDDQVQREWSDFDLNELAVRNGAEKREIMCQQIDSRT